MLRTSVDQDQTKVDQVRDAVEATAASIASKATGTGSAVTMVGWLTSSELGMWVGIAIGVTGLAVNWYYKQKADRRAHERHTLQLYRLRDNVMMKIDETDE